MKFSLPKYGYLPATPVDPLTLSLGADGSYFNCQSIANMRQDNINTAAAVGQPVGMFFDTWVANTLGADTVSNGTFATVTTGWTAASATLSIVSARLRVANSGAAAGRAHQSQTTVVGTTYKVTVDLVTNANGAALAVGTSNSNMNLFLLTIPAGTTGSYTVYFIATSTSSFIQLRTTSTTNGHFTEWDNVVCKSIAGRHLIQQTSTARPILRQDALGHYYLEPDGVDDFITGGLGTYTVQLPHYIACMVRRQGTATEFVFGVIQTAANYHLFRGGSNRMDAALRESVIGTSAPTGTSNTQPSGRLAVSDSLAVVGTTDVIESRRLANTAANSWLVGTQLTLCTPGIFASGTAAASAQTNRFYAGVSMCQTVSAANRAGIRAYLANLGGAD